MSSATVIERALAAWDAEPRLAFCFGDFATFAQCHIARFDKALGAADCVSDATDAREAAERERAEQRLAVLRRPFDTVARAPIAERVGNRLTVWCYGAVDPNRADTGISSVAVCAALEAHADAQVIIVRLASSGGSAAGAEQIANTLISHRGRSVVIVDREAFSAASIIAAAGDQCWMRRGTMWMTHRGSAPAYGTSEILQQIAATLRVMDMGHIKFIARRRRLNYYDVQKLHDAEQYLTAEEALATRLCDRVIHPLITPDPKPLARVADDNDCATRSTA